MRKKALPYTCEEMFDAPEIGSRWAREGITNRGQIDHAMLIQQENAPSRLQYPIGGDAAFSRAHHLAWKATRYASTRPEFAPRAAQLHAHAAKLGMRLGKKASALVKQHAQLAEAHGARRPVTRVPLSAPKQLKIAGTETTSSSSPRPPRDVA